MEGIVHICNGDVTADGLSLADLPGEIRVWADALDRGPVQALPDDEHYRARGEFWASRGEGSASAVNGGIWNLKRTMGHERHCIAEKLRSTT